MRFISLLCASLIIVSMTSFSPGLKISSAVFPDNGMIPSKYSCEGVNASPPLHISGIPAGTKSLALILHDPDAPMAGGFTHWVMWNIDVNGEIPENFKGAAQGLNGAGKPGYYGMCPPSGTHHYHFKVYALDIKLDIDKNTDKAGLEKTIQGHVLAEGELVGLYKKTK